MCRTRLALAAGFLFLIACDARLPNESEARWVAPARDVGDAAHSSQLQGFYWLPPLVKEADFGGTLDAGLLPHVAVEICEWSGDACEELVARFTSAGEGSEAVRHAVEGQDGSHFHVNWHTGHSLDVEKTHRITVRVAGTPVGFADVRLAHSSTELHDMDESRYIGVVLGQTVPLKFRIETGVVTVLGAEGGTIVAAGGAVRLDVPAGALATAIGITVRAANELAGDPRLIAGTAFEIGPKDLPLNQPAALTLSYTQANIPNELEECELRLGRFVGSSWTVQSGTADAAANQVMGQITQLGAFGAILSNLRELLAAEITRYAREGQIPLPLPSAKRRPLELGPLNDTLVDLLLAEGLQSPFAIGVDPLAFGRSPVLVQPQDLQVSFCTAPSAALANAAAQHEPDVMGDPQIRAAIAALIQRMRDVGGFNFPGGEPSNWAAALLATKFHEEGPQAGGVRILPGALALTFSVRPTDRNHVFMYEGQFILVTDGSSHTVFRQIDAALLRAGNLFGADQTLTMPAKIALHELIHRILYLNDQRERDDADDEMVIALEIALIDKFNIELTRGADGRPDPKLVSIYSDAMTVVEELDASDLAALLGLPGVAANLNVAAPERVKLLETFDVDIEVVGNDGSPAPNEDVFVSETQVDMDGRLLFPVKLSSLRTDQFGKIRLQMTSDTTPGEIRLRVSVLGRMVNPVIEVSSGGPPEVASFVEVTGGRDLGVDGTGSFNPLNAAGKVALTTNCGTPANLSCALLWSGAPVAIGDEGTQAYAINASGTMAGKFFPDPRNSPDAFAALFNGGTTVDLGVRGRSSVAVDVNGTGQVAGRITHLLANGTLRQNGFFWENGNVTEINSLDGQVLPASINDLNQIVGWIQQVAVSSPFVWENGELRVLPGGVGRAVDINASGHVVGGVGGVNLPQHGALWRDNQLTTVTGLGAINSFAFAINDKDQVVGQVAISGVGLRPFFWQDGKMWNLDDLVNALQPPPPSCQPLSRAFAINDRGQILARNQAGSCILLITLK